MAAAKRQQTTAEQQMAARQKPRPQSIEDLAPDEEMSAEEIASLEEGKTRDPRAALSDAANPQSAIIEGAPPWAQIPHDLIVPKNVEVMFFNIKGRTKDWNIITWELSVRDERLARARTMGDAQRLVDENAKQMIRAVNGAAVTGADPVMIDQLWEDIGGKFRSVLQSTFLKTTALTNEERVDFFMNRAAARRSV